MKLLNLDDALHIMRNPILSEEEIKECKNIIEKSQLKQLPQSITLPIEDYNRLRKLELKAEIKRLKRELKGL